MFRLIQLKSQSKSAEVEEGIKGAPASDSADLSDITSVLSEINEKMNTIIERIELIEEKMDSTELEEQEIEYRNEIKDILNSINEKELSVNMDLEDLKVNDPMNEEILTEIQDTKMMITDNIDMSKEFVSVGFGVLIGVIVGYVSLKFLLWRQ